MRALRRWSPFVSCSMAFVFVVSLAPRRAFANEAHAAEVLEALAPSASTESAAAPTTRERRTLAASAHARDIEALPLASTMHPLALATGEPAEKSGVSAQAISVPQGAGKVQGMGESFTAQLSTGIAALTIPLSLPAARGAVHPSLSLAYSSSGGHGLAGVGWSLSFPYIARQTDRGLPRYNDPAAGQGWSANQDRFVTSGGGELVPICQVSAGGECAGALAGEVMPSWAAGWLYYRTAIESEFARYFWSPDRQTWRVQTKDGGSQEYGVPLDGSGDTNALESDPAQPSHVFRWDLSRQYDAHGDVNLAPGAAVHPLNVARYRYKKGTGISYLEDIYDTPPASGNDSAPLASWAHHTHLVYENRTDPKTGYKRGYPSVDALRLNGVDITSKTFAGDSARELLRRYHVAYDPNYHVSLLTQFQLEGRCDAAIAEDASGLLPSTTSCPRLPAMTFDYGHVAGATPSDLAGYEPFDVTPHSFAGSPKVNIDGQRADFFDVDADAIPDVLVTDVNTYGARYGVFFNGASGDADSFTADTAGIAGVLNGSSVSVTLSNSTVAPIDIDGNGVVDLLHMPRTQTYAVYTPTHASDGWTFQGRVVPTAGGQSPLIDFTANAKQTKTMDVNGDGVLDVVTVNGGALQTFFGLGRYAGGDAQFGNAQWTSATTAAISIQPTVMCLPWSSMTVQLGDPDVKIADMNGDGLPDIARVRNGDIRYWPGRGNGYWGTQRSDNCPKGTIASGRDVAMASSPTFPSDASQMRLRDLNGDGLDDLVQIRSDGIDVWLNVDGASFTSRAHTIATSAITQSSTANGRMRFLDVNASGTTDLVWGEGWKYQYVDLQGGARPWLLTHYANGLGKTTDLEYTTSTVQMLAARKAGAPWATTAPMPIHVLAKVTERDHLSALGRAPGEYVREYTYRDPVYDGRAREFRGFRSVKAVERGDSGSPTSIVDSTFALGECVADPNDSGVSPCSAQGAWRSNPREALKGLTLLTETHDETGRYLSTEHTTQRLRTLYSGLDGRDVRHAFASTHDRFLYDVGSFVPSPGHVSVDDVELDVAGAVTGQGGDVVTRASYARIRTRDEVDSFGNKATSIDEGCVDGCGTTDEVIASMHKAARPTGDASGWLWREAEKATSGNRHPGRTFQHTRSFYNAAGDTLRNEAELAGSLPLVRSHEDPSQAVAPAPAAASQDGWILATATEEDAFGNVISAQTGHGRCHRMTVDTAFAQLVVNEQVMVGPADNNGCGTQALTASALYDRGLASSTLAIDVHGELTTAKFDGFGRISELRRPDPTIPSLVDAYASQRYEYILPTDAAATPWSIVHIIAHDAPSIDTEAYSQSWMFSDGMGRAIAEVHQADPAAGDAGAWRVDKLTDYDRRGSARHVTRAWFSNGDPLAILSGAAPASPLSETRYDAFGRAIEDYALDGALVMRTVHHAMSDDTWNARDLVPGADPVPVTAQRDGHGRAIVTTERLHTQSGQESHSTSTSYGPGGEVESVVRSSSSGDAPVVRWMIFDSLGRRVLNVEPNTARGAVGTVGADPSAVRAWRYAYDDAGDLVGTSDARGCGTNYSYDSAGRLVGEDYSPCASSQPAYTPADPITLSGLEVAYQYDAPSADAPSDFAATFLAGRLASIRDRASESLSSYDARGRLVALAKRVALPDGQGYAPRWYVQHFGYDVVDRPIQDSTRTLSPELLGSDGASTVTTTYGHNGRVIGVAGSYGVLLRDIKHDAKGLIQSFTFGDAAATKASFAYDARDRVVHSEARRDAPDSWTATPAAYTPAPSLSSRADTLQLLLASNDLTYDVMNRVIADHDSRDSSEWPAGAKPVDRAMQYDDLGRITRVDYAYSGGADAWISPTAAEESGASTSRGTMPRVAFDKRVTWQSYAYDWQGNIASTHDDASGFFDRSLGMATHGTATAGPNQLLSAADAASARGGSVAVRYDDAGEMTGLVVRRAGPCLPAGGVCNHRFVYDWDEVGRLARARRWDLADPGAPTDAIPSTMPAADLKYAYDATDTRVLKSATDANGVTRHTVYVFPSLELRQTEIADGDYARGPGVETVQLRAHGIPLGEVNYATQDVPSLASGRQHVLLRLGDHLGSTTGMLDMATGELVERRTYQPYGAEESDYRPARWAAFHAPYGFTGKEEDSEIGLQYFGHRYLSGALMRWISPDPLALHQLKEDPNVYAYIHGNVFAATDPNGLGQEDTHAGVTYLLGLAAGLDPLDAGRIAFACAGVDHNPATNPVSAAHYYNWTTWAFHFDREGASSRLDAEIGKGKDMSLAMVGTWFHTLEDTGFTAKTPGPHMRGQMSLLDKTLRLFTSTPPPGRSTHGTFTLESGEKSHGTSHAVDLIKNDPFRNAQLFMDIYRKLSVVADAKSEGKGRAPNDAAAIRMIEDIVGAGGKTPTNPLTMNPADYGLPGRPYDDYTSRIPGYQFNMNSDNPNGKGTQTPVDNAN